MIYRDFQDKKLSALGFGTMRLPTGPNGSIDEEQVRRMTRYAIDQLFRHRLSLPQRKLRAGYWPGAEGLSPGQLLSCHQVPGPPDSERRLQSRRDLRGAAAQVRCGIFRLLLFSSRNTTEKRPTTLTPTSAHAVGSHSAERRRIRRLSPVFTAAFIPGTLRSCSPIPGRRNWQNI